MSTLSRPFCGGAAAPSETVGMPGCDTTCGNINVPYPFGMGPARCYHSAGFNLTCDRISHPPRLLLGYDGTLQVTEITLWSSTVRVVRAATRAIIKTTSSQDRRNTAFGASFTGANSGVAVAVASPYKLSRGNELILTGCNALAELLDGTGNVVSGCASFCRLTGAAGPRIFLDVPCSGSGCCRAPIYNPVAPGELQFRWLNGKNHSQDMAALPTYVLVAEEGWFDQAAVAHQLRTGQSVAELEVPMVLQWTVKQGLAVANFSLTGNGGCSGEVTHNLCKSKHTVCVNLGDEDGYICQCWFGHDGNPYVTDGCKDVDECEQAEQYGCFGECTNLPGTFDCRCPPGTHGNHTIPGGCAKSTKDLSIGIGVGSGAAVVLFILLAFFLGQKLKHRRKQMMKRKFFDQNRGRLLQQLVSQRADIAERMIITLEELEKATNNFDKARELGRGGHGTVYKGILSDLHVVAIKKTKKVVQKEIDEFINEVAILSQINHRNVVKLYGCCLETEVPMLVYEFISNGTLYDHLHITEPRSLSWKNRLRIATETAKSLAYLHTTVSIPIIHRDIKSANILLDDTLASKVADFGASRYIPVDKSGATTMVQGTIGYLDPMYFCTGRLTEKSDVYSFGVMLLELLTRKKPFAYLSSQGNGLVAHFVILFAEGNLSQLLDPQVMDEGGKEVGEVAALVIACVKITGEGRPSMRHVELTLEGLQASKGHVLDNATSDISEVNGTATNSRVTTSLSNRKESSRQYSMEEEFILSSRYPR
ncbi:wall-associated receptor kinase 3-like [Triticum aestivum]|nr:wall-associated receptor kinase 3-like [Triticum aestivum]